MIPLIAFQRGPSRIGVLPGRRTETDDATTMGGRDKRRGTEARYVVVVAGYFARRGHGRSATQPPKSLLSRGFPRAARFQAETLS